MVDGSGEEQRPDLTAALLGRSQADDAEAAEADAGAENDDVLALPAPPVQNGLSYALVLHRTARNSAFPAVGTVLLL